MNLAQVERELAAWRDESKPVVPVSVRGASREAEGLVMVERWSKGQRQLRALKVFLLFIVIAACSILIPILHFVLVPLFSLMAFIGASFSYARRERIKGGVGTCPECGKNFPIFAGGSRWPIHDRCTECQRPVVVTVTSPASRKL